MMYSFLYDTQGVNTANEYLKAIEDHLNQTAGRREADAFLQSIKDENGQINVDLFNAAKLSGKGFLDGLETFGEGLTTVMATEGKISTNQYAQMYILDALGADFLLKSAYDAGLYTGTLTPTFIASSLVSVFATPAVGQTVGAGLLFTSTLGTTKNQALIDGNGMLESCLYGTFVSLSSVGLSTLIGKIPGLSSTSGLTLKNIALGGVNKASLTATKQFISWITLGDVEIDMSKFPEELLVDFVTGALVTTAFNGTNHIMKFKFENQTVEVTTNTILKYLEDHPNSKVIDVLKAYVPVFVKDSAMVLANANSTAPKYYSHLFTYDSLPSKFSLYALPTIKNLPIISTAPLHTVANYPTSGSAGQVK